MNKLSLKEIKNITKVIKTNNVSDDNVFDYYRIVGLKNEKDEIKNSNPLYFITYATEEESNDGWYIDRIDLRRYIDKIMKDNEDYTFVVDKTMLDNLNDKYKYIIVEDLNNTIDDLFNYFKNKSHAKTIAITGSVGKTTCVGIIESVLKTKYNIWRIYSKRITPLLLKANIINYLNDDIEYIVLENSIYYHDHVKILADLMEPVVTAILNIESSHQGIELLNTVDDICKYKSLIMQHSKKCFIIKGDKYLDNLHLDSGKLYYNDELILENKNLDLEKIDLSKIKVENNKFVIDNIIINPFILSSLAQKQYAVAYYIGKYLGLTNDEIEIGINSFSQVENRVNKQIAFGKEIIFDGDITTYERIKELSDNMYDNKYLVLRKVGSAENTLRIANIKDFFSKYKNVYIFDDVEYLEELKNEPNVIIVNNHDFMKQLNGIIIYHYSGYFRVWNEYNENNLKIYDREKYPIIKEN